MGLPFSKTRREAAACVSPHEIKPPRVCIAGTEISYVKSNVTAARSLPVMSA